MIEAELAAEIIAECGRRGLLVHHCRDSRHCEGTPGLPDLIIASPRGVVFAELKGTDGETSADQDLWLYALHMAGGRQIVWWPRDWESGKIQKRLARLARPGLG